MLISYSELIEQIVALDGRVRFAGVANMLGKVIASCYRRGLIPLLNGEETEQTIPQSAVKSNCQQPLEEKLGRSLYTVTTYERVKRAMVPLYDLNGSVRSILLVSFNPETSGSDVDSIILERILPLVRGNDDIQRICR